MPLAAAKFMISLPAESIPKEAEITIWKNGQNIRPARQRTVRSETRKDKAGALSPAVYQKAKARTWSKLFFQIAGRKVQPLQFLMNQYSCLRHLTVRFTLLSVARKLPKSSSSPTRNLSKWMNLKSASDSDYIWWNRTRGDCRTQKCHSKIM